MTRKPADNGSGQPPTARVTRRFAAPAERVFDAWLDPAGVRRWMTASGAMNNLQRVDIDARVGGKFSFVDRRGESDVDHAGTYLEIDRPRRLRFTWGVAGQSVERSVVTLDLAPLGAGGCELTLTHTLDPEWADFVERTQHAWAMMLAGIAATLA